MAPLKRNRNHSLVFGADVELVVSRQQGGGEHSGSEHPRKSSGAEDGYAQGRADVSCIFGDRKRRDLAIGQSLRFGEGVGLAGVEMQNATIQSADPQVRLTSGQGGHVKVFQRGMKNRDLFSVIDEHASLFGAHKKMAGSNRQNRGDRSCVDVVRENLSEGAAIEGQQPVVGGSKDEFWFAGVGQNGGRQRDQRRSGEFAADGILAEQGATRLIFEQPRRTGNIKMILEPGCLEEYGGRTDHLEIRLNRRGQRPNHEANLVLRANIRRCRMQSPRGAPDYDRSERQQEKNRSRDHCSNRRDGWLHKSSSQESEL